MVATISGINWNNIAVLSNFGFNWSSIGTLCDGVNWNSLSQLSKQGINWGTVYAWSREDVNWDNIVWDGNGIGNGIQFTPTDLYTLRTIGVKPNAFLPAAPTSAYLTINLTGSGTGTITSLPNGIYCATGTTTNCSVSFPLNQPINLYFNPIGNSAVSNWGGCTQTSYDSCTVTLDGNIVVNIAVNPTYTMTSSVKGAGGTIEPLGVTNVISGQSQTYTMTASAGYAFGSFTITGNNCDPGVICPTQESSLIPLPSTTYTINNVTSNGSIQAAFNLAYNLTIQKTGKGNGTLVNTVSPIPNYPYSCISQNGVTVSCSSTYFSGATVTWTATPETGSVFTGWTGIPGCSTQNPCKFVINSNIKATAEFDLQVQSVSVPKTAQD